MIDQAVGDEADPPARTADPADPGDPAEAAAGDQLPFTGLDLGLVAAAGASLLLLGVGMRRLTRAQDSAV